MYIHVTIHIHISGVVSNRPLATEGTYFCYYLPPILLKLQPLTGS